MKLAGLGQRMPVGSHPLPGCKGGNDRLANDHGRSLAPYGRTPRANEEPCGRRGFRYLLCNQFSVTVEHLLILEGGIFGSFADL